MTTENVKPIEIIKKESEASSFKPVKKEKNPNRVAGGKKGVEARKMKEELLRKENQKLKEITMKIEESREVQYLKEVDEVDSLASLASLVPTRELFKNNKKNSIEEDSKESKTPNYTLLLFLSIGIGGIGLYFFKKRKQESPVLVVPEKKESVRKMIQKKEIDPFDFC